MEFTTFHVSYEQVLTNMVCHPSYLFDWNKDSRNMNFKVVHKAEWVYTFQDILKLTVLISKLFMYRQI